MDSKEFFDSTLYLTFSSSALNLSASLTNRSMSYLDNLPLSFVIVILFNFFVALSSAEMFIIPFSSISKDTSIYGTPLGAGAIPSN